MRKKSDNMSLVPAERIERSILLIRGQKVMLDSDLASLYRVTVSRLNEAVKRNINRFPSDFMFQLNSKEQAILKSQFVTSKNLKSQIAISSLNYGGRRYTPYVFTEQGVAMLSSVLRSDRAVQVNIAIMRTFVHLRRMLASHKDLANKIEEMEKKYDHRFRIVFEAIRKLMEEPVHTPKPIGFRIKKK